MIKLNEDLNSLYSYVEGLKLTANYIDTEIKKEKSTNGGILVKLSYIGYTLTIRRQRNKDYFTLESNLYPKQTTTTNSEDFEGMTSTAQEFVYRAITVDLFNSKVKGLKVSKSKIKIDFDGENIIIINNGVAQMFKYVDTMESIFEHVEIKSPYIQDLVTATQNLLPSIVDLNIAEYIDNFGRKAILNISFAYIDLDTGVVREDGFDVDVKVSITTTGGLALVDILSSTDIQKEGKVINVFNSLSTKSYTFSKSVISSDMNNLKEIIFYISDAIVSLIKPKDAIIDKIEQDSKNRDARFEELTSLMQNLISCYNSTREDYRTIFRDLSIESRWKIKTKKRGTLSGLTEVKSDLYHVHSYDMLTEEGCIGNITLDKNTNPVTVSISFFFPQGTTVLSFKDSKNPTSTELLNNFKSILIKAFSSITPIYREILLYKDYLKCANKPYKQYIGITVADFTLKSACETNVYTFDEFENDINLYITKNSKYEFNIPKYTFDYFVSENLYTLGKRAKEKESLDLPKVGKHSDDAIYDFIKQVLRNNKKEVTQLETTLSSWKSSVRVSNNIKVQTRRVCEISKFGSILSITPVFRNNGYALTVLYTVAGYTGKPIYQVKESNDIDTKNLYDDLKLCYQAIISLLNTCLPEILNYDKYLTSKGINSFDFIKFSRNNITMLSEDKKISYKLTFTGEDTFCINSAQGSSGILMFKDINNFINNFLKVNKDVTTVKDKSLVLYKTYLDRGTVYEHKGYRFMDNLGNGADVNKEVGDKLQLQSLCNKERIVLTPTGKGLCSKDEIARNYIFSDISSDTALCTKYKSLVRRTK